MKEIAEILGPSQMAGGFESPEGEKFLRPSGSKRQSRAVQNLIQNYSKVLQNIGGFLKKAT